MEEVEAQGQWPGFGESSGVFLPSKYAVSSVGPALRARRLSIAPLWEL